MLTEETWTRLWTEAGKGLRGHQRAIVVALLLQLVDVASTHLGLGAGMQEVNFATSKVLGLAGKNGMYGMKFAVIAAVICVTVLLGKRYPGVWRALQWSNAAMALVVSMNVAQLVLAPAL